MLEKLKYYFVGAQVGTFFILSKIQFAFAADIGFNEKEAIRVIKKFTGPVFNTLLWVAPILAAIAISYKVIKYFCSDDEDRERKKPSKDIKMILKYLIIVEIISTIFSIVGITINR